MKQFAYSNQSMKLRIASFRITVATHSTSSVAAFEIHSSSIVASPATMTTSIKVS